VSTVLYCTTATGCQLYCTVLSTHLQLNISYIIYHEIEKNEMSVACSTYGGEEKRVQCLVGKHEG
jgi:hypothetical protein